MLLIFIQQKKCHEQIKDLQCRISPCWQVENVNGDRIPQVTPEDIKNEQHAGLNNVQSQDTHAETNQIWRRDEFLGSCSGANWGFWSGFNSWFLSIQDSEIDLPFLVCNIYARLRGSETPASMIVFTLVGPIGVIWEKFFCTFRFHVYCWRLNRSTLLKINASTSCLIRKKKLIYTK